MADVSAFTHGTELLWTPARRQRAAVPEECLAWLPDQASLTQRLIRACAGRFRVEVLNQRRLAYLRNRSLGAVLFADPTMHRGEVEIARIPHADQLFALATARLSRPPDEIWGRRSTFYLSGKPLLVSEFFLPGVGAFPS